jgi:hypothetical protein
MANDAEPIVIRDIDVPFWRIVTILIKWSIAAIPAAIVIAILYTLIFAVVGGLAVGVMELLGIAIPEVPPPVTP